MGGMKRVTALQAYQTGRIGTLPNSFTHVRGRQCVQSASEGTPVCVDSSWLTSRPVGRADTLAVGDSRAQSEAHYTSRAPAKTHSPDPEHIVSVLRCRDSRIGGVVHRPLLGGRLYREARCGH